MFGGVECRRVCVLTMLKFVKMRSKTLLSDLHEFGIKAVSFGFAGLYGATLAHSFMAGVLCVTTVAVGIVLLICGASKNEQS